MVAVMCSNCFSSVELLRDDGRITNYSIFGSLLKKFFSTCARNHTCLDYEDIKDRCMGMCAHSKTIITMFGRGRVDQFH